MNTAKLRDAWLIAMIAVLVLGFGYTQTSAKRTELTGKAYTFAISTGPQLQLLDRRDQLPAHRQALICERTINLAAAKLGHNCKSPINGLASMAVQ